MRIWDMMVLGVFAAGVGCAPTKPYVPTVTPPLPSNLTEEGGPGEYYPDASKRAKETGRVVLDLTIDATGVIKSSIPVDTETAATQRLVVAASQIFHGVKLDAGRGFKSKVRASIIFELQTCGQLTHAMEADYRVSLCEHQWSLRYRQSTADRIPESTLEYQVHAVLMHNDLSDVNFLERTLGIRFRVTGPVHSPYGYPVTAEPHVEVTPAWIPSSIEVPELAYSTNHGEGNVLIRLTFRPRDRADVSLWAAHWRTEVEQGIDPHGMGSSERLSLGGKRDVHLDVWNSWDGSQRISLSQTESEREPFASHLDLLRSDSGPFVKQIVALVRAGDLRDATNTSNILHADVRSRRSLGYGQVYEAHALIPGTKSFMYVINDTGLYADTTFLLHPPERADRIAELSLTLDGHHVCVSNAQIEGELKRQSTKYRRNENRDWINYRFRGKNELTLSTRSFEGCLTDISLRQMTDVDHPRDPKAIEIFPLCQPSSPCEPGIMKY